MTCFGLSVPYVPLLRFGAKKGPGTPNSSHDVPGTEVVLFLWESLRTRPLYHSVKKQHGLLSGTMVPLCLFCLGSDRPPKKDIALCSRLVAVIRVPRADIPHASSIAYAGRYGTPSGAFQNFAVVVI